MALASSQDPTTFHTVLYLCFSAESYWLLYDSVHPTQGAILNPYRYQKNLVETKFFLFFSSEFLLLREATCLLKFPKWFPHPVNRVLGTLQDIELKPFASHYVSQSDLSS